MKSTYPDYKKRLVSVPKCFQYSVKTHGIPSEGRRMLKNYEGEYREKLHTWVKATRGKSAEEEIFTMLTTMFSDEPCLLVSGFTENILLKVVRENLRREGKGLKLSEKVSNIDATSFRLIFFRNETFTF